MTAPGHHHRPARTPGTGADRRALLAKIHVAKKQLALDDATYRAVVKRIIGVDSAGAATDGKLVELLDEFKRQGFQPASGSRHTSAKPWVRKIHAIWKDLAPLLDDATPAALNGFVARQTKTARNPDGISAAEFLDANSATKVIQGLEGWLSRMEGKAP